ncbi:Protein of unknown function [Selenomonas ruminantium]|uniref:DUF3298 domain-containing protein n=1 Tax=Selenomonas ruminantium TaxID=971 RepID=A0A1M6W3L1_SELRU|nr:RsiV family protein [Selenomonas ruminantium]SHK88247.1 Protein of unknown function [Selenomonas ruminantium]
MLGRKKIGSLLCASLMVMAVPLAGKAAEIQQPRAVNGLYKQVHQQNDMDKDERGEYELLHQRWAGLAVDKELRGLYPELAAAIERRTKADWARVQKERKGMKVEARQFRRDVPQYYHSFVQDVDVLVRRADNYVVSYLEMGATEGAGAHGMYGWQGVNLNTLSGEELALAHVVKDTGKLTDLIIARLKKDYPQANFIDMKKQVRSFALQGKLNWTLDPRGITFYFNPYEIAPYAEGLLSVTLLYQEYPQLFHESYLRTVKEYAQPFPGNYPLTTSLRDDERRDVLTVQEGSESLYVELNGRKTEWDTHLTDLQPVLIHMKDKKNYLYIDGRTPEGPRQTIVFKVQRGKVQHIGTLPYTFQHIEAVSPVQQEYWRFLTNPDGFYFDRNATQGNSSKTDICAVGDDGLLTFG